MAPQLDTSRGQLRYELAELRDKATCDGEHARTPGIVADLALGLRYLLDFARSVEAISETERGDLYRRGWTALVEAAATHAGHIATAEPTRLFLQLLSAAVASGRAHVADPEGCAPIAPERWGWRLRKVGAGDNAREEWQPQGHLVGWTEGKNLYLEPDSAYAEAQRLAVEQGENLSITPQTLRKRLKDKGLLASIDSRRQKLTVRKTVQGTRRDVMHLVLTPDSPLCATGPTGPGDPNAPENGPVSGAGSWAGNGQANGAPAHEMAAAGTSGQVPTAVGPEMGRLGQLDTGEDGTAGKNNSAQQADGWGDWQ